MGSFSLQKIVSAAVAATVIYVLGEFCAQSIDPKLLLPISLAAFRVVDDALLNYLQLRRVRGDVRELLTQLLDDAASNRETPPPWELLSERLHQLMGRESPTLRAPIRRCLQCIVAHATHRTHQAIRVADLEPMQALRKRLS